MSVKSYTHSDTPGPPLLPETEDYSNPQVLEFYEYYAQFWREFEEELYLELSRKDIKETSHRFTSSTN